MKALTIALVCAAALTVAAQPKVNLLLPVLGTRTEPIRGYISNTGTLSPNNYKMAILTSADGGRTWWDKSHTPYFLAWQRNPAAMPNPGEVQNAAVVIQADWTFTLSDWSADVRDAVSPLWRGYLVPKTYDMRWPQYEIEGIGMRGDLVNAAVAMAEATRTNTPPAPLPVTPVTPPAAAPPASVGGTATLTLTAFPAANTMNPVSGKVTGLTGAANTYKAVLYLQGENVWWIKPQPGSATTLNADGTFTIANWASYAPTDPKFQAIQIYIIPAATGVVNALGAGLPAAMATASVATGNFPAGYTVTAAPPVAPPAAASPAAPPATGGTTGTFTMTAPAVGSAAAITGTVTGVTATGMKVAVYVRTATGVLWGPKPQTANVITLTGGDWTLSNWNSGGAGDTNAPALVAYLLPATATAPAIAGAAAPAALTSVALATVASTRTGAAVSATFTGSGGAAPPAAPPAASVAASPAERPSTGTPTLTLVAGSIGSNAPITGKLSGVTIAGQKVALYVKTATGVLWGPKPQPANTWTVAGDGSFATNVDWASGGAGDLNAPAIVAIAFPANVNAPTIAGAAMPALAALGAVATAEGARTTAPVAPAPPAAAPGADGQIVWPPTTDPGAKVNAGGRLNIGGYNCVIKDTNGGTWGPGNNVFVGNNKFIWTDNWGLHLNVRPRYANCGGWASSECYFDRPLGYGNYVFRIVGPVEYQDFQTTLGAFTWDDDCPGECFYREIDYEWGRWGNQNDYNNAQFVVQPFYRAGNIRRFPMKTATRYPGGQGDNGGGGCDASGENEFNGATVGRVTCVIQWFARLIRWFCFDGLWKLNQLTGQAGRLLGSWDYGNKDYVFTPGNERVHLNLWQANDGVPGWGRRVHYTFQDFEFSTQYIDFPAAGVPTNRLLLASGQLIEDINREQIYDSISDLADELDEHERETLLDLIRRRAHGSTHEHSGWNVTRIRDWLSQLPLVTHSSEAVQKAKSFLRSDHDSFDGHDIETATRRALQSDTSSGTSMSCGDPRGNNLADFGIAAAMYGQAVSGSSSSSDGSVSGSSYDSSSTYSSGSGYGQSYYTQQQQTYGGYDTSSSSSSSEAASDGSLPAWASDASKTGYYGPNGWVAGTDTASSGGGGGGDSGGISKTAVAVLSVCGTLVAMVSLFVAGVLIRRRFSRPSSSAHHSFSPATLLNSGKKSSSSSTRVRAASAGHEEAEMNPLAEAEGKKSSKSGKVVPSAK